jgi:hypothetical protein
MQEDKHYYQALALLRRLQAAVGSYVAAAGRQPTTWCEEQIHATEQAIASANDRARAGSTAPEGDKMPISERFYRPSLRPSLRPSSKYDVTAAFSSATKNRGAERFGSFGCPEQRWCQYTD